MSLIITSQNRLNVKTMMAFLIWLPFMVEKAEAVCRWNNYLEEI
jgi:hypothetical protein